MAITLKVNGNPGNERLLIAPAGGQEFPMAVALKSTDSTTVNAKLVVVAPAGVTVKLSSTSVTIGPNGTSVKITAQTPSKSAGDIKLQVKVGASVKASCTLTSIKNVRLRFGGRFQARFPTDGDFFNEKRGTTAGWTWALEGEPDFVPAGNTIPTQPGMAVGRVVRFQNAVAPRPTWPQSASRLRRWRATLATRPSPSRPAIHHWRTRQPWSKHLSRVQSTHPAGAAAFRTLRSRLRADGELRNPHWN